MTRDAKRAEATGLIARNASRHSDRGYNGQDLRALAGIARPPQYGSWRYERFMRFLLIEPNDMAPLQKRFMMDSTGPPLRAEAAFGELEVTSRAACRASDSSISSALCIL